MPIYTFHCDACEYDLDDVLCTYEEAQSKQCTRCGKYVMTIVPATCSIVWSGDTSFSVSKKTIKE